MHCICSLENIFNKQEGIERTGKVKITGFGKWEMRPFLP